ncbi:MAG: nucleotidyltransferase [Ginsengibacter sp.]
MPRFSEYTLNNWRMPPSNSEEIKLANSQRLVKDAIDSDSQLNKFTIEIFGQGSYANDTNVRLDSDVDINVRLADTIFIELPDGKKQEEFGYSDSNYTFSEYKNSIYNALVKKFGQPDVVRNDKCITVKGNAYRVITDVVPTFKLIRHDENGVKHLGSKFISDSGIAITNYSLQHIENGKLKNAATQKRFKRLTRIYRRVRYKMAEEEYCENKNITSFLLECLVFNVPNKIFNNYDTWLERVKQSIVNLFNQTKEDEKCKDWGEVSELLYLFRGARKWTIKDVNEYLIKMWNYFEF